MKRTAILFLIFITVLLSGCAKAYDSGYDNGYYDAKDKYQIDYDSGFEDGRESGYSDGFTECFVFMMESMSQAEQDAWIERNRPTIDKDSPFYYALNYYETYYK